MIRSALAFAAVLACTPAADPKTDPKTDPKADPKAECAARVAAIRGLFAQIGPEMLVISTPEGMSLATSSRGGAVEDGIPLFLREDGSFEFDARRIPDVATMQGLLAEEFEKAEMLAERLGKGSTMRMLVVADRRAPVAVLRELVVATRAGTKFALVVDLEGDVLPTPPPIPEAVRAVRELPPFDRSGRMADVITAAIGTCEPVREVFGAVATADADKRSQTLYEGLPGAIERCGCAQGMDVETLVAAVWTMGAKTEPEKRQLELPLSGDAGVEAVALAKDAKVAELVTLVEQRGGRPFRLEWKP